MNPDDITSVNPATTSPATDPSDLSDPSDQSDPSDPSNPSDLPNPSDDLLERLRNYVFLEDDQDILPEQLDDKGFPKDPDFARELTENLHNVLNAFAKERDATANPFPDDTLPGCPDTPIPARGAAETYIEIASEYTPDPVMHLWDPYVPLGKVTLLAGKPGVGKTWAALHLAAQVTNGTTGLEPADVVYASAADMIDDTLLPRFTQFGGDPSRLLFWTGVAHRCQPTWDVSTDRITLSYLDALHNLCKRRSPKLVVIDDIHAFALPPKGRKKIAIADALAHLHYIAQTLGIAVLVISHIKRIYPNNPLASIPGPSTMTTVPRSILLMTQPDPESTNGAMLQLKNNLGPRAQAIGYTITDSGFAWTDPIPPDDQPTLLQSKIKNPKSKIDPFSVATTYLQNSLKEGPARADYLLANAPVSGPTLRRAKAALNIAAVKASTARGPWLWAFPNQLPLKDDHQKKNNAPLPHRPQNSTEAVITATNEPIQQSRTPTSHSPQSKNETDVPPDPPPRGPRVLTFKWKDDSIGFI